MSIYDYLIIDPESKVPIYKQLVMGFERFKRKTPPLSPLPPERDMAEKLGISRTSLRQALKNCRNSGILIQKWGKGIFTCGEQSQKRILVFLPEFQETAHPWHYILPGIEERCKERSIIVEKMDLRFARTQTKEEIKDFIVREDFSGVMHLDYMDWLEAPEIMALLDLDIPVIYPHTHPSWAKNIPFLSLIVDEKKAFRLAAETLVKLGHRKFVTITPGREHLRDYTVGEYRRMLLEIGCEGFPEDLLFVTKDISALDSLLPLFRQVNAPTAILCFSDFVALSVIKFLKKHHLAIPEDVSVLGFCGFPGGKFMTPALSTIDFHYHEIGRFAVDSLFSLPRRKVSDSGIMQYTDYTIVLRESSRKLIRKKQPSRKADDCFEITV